MRWSKVGLRAPHEGRVRLLLALATAHHAHNVFALLPPSLLLYLCLLTCAFSFSLNHFNLAVTFCWFLLQDLKFWPPPPPPLPPSLPPSSSPKSTVPATPFSRRHDTSPEAYSVLRVCVCVSTDRQTAFVPLVSSRQTRAARPQPLACSLAQRRDAPSTHSGGGCFTRFPLPFPPLSLFASFSLLFPACASCAPTCVRDSAPLSDTHTAHHTTHTGPHVRTPPTKDCRCPI